MRHIEGSWAALAASALMLAGCQDLPEITYRTEHLELGTDFDAKVCEGTLGVLERAARRSNDLATTPGTDPFVVYWFEHGLPEPCTDVSGCFYPGTRLVLARGESIAHELVHAAIDSPGEAFFIEEGLAELMGGVGVRYDAARLEGQLGTQLGLTRRDYRHDRLSYPQAAHFAQWVQQAKGDAAVVGLAAALNEPDTGTAVREQLEEIFGASLAEIEQQYADSAHFLYRGTMDPELEQLELGASGLWASISLDCGDADVLGPLPGGEPGMYRALRLVVREPRSAALIVDGEPGTRVELLEPYARRVEPYALWWPSLEQESRIARVDRGKRASVRLKATTYLLVFIAEGEQPATVDLQISH